MLKVLDISHFQNVQDFKKVLDAGVSAVICKATDGLTQDPTFQWKAQHAKDAGLVVGAYHFFRPLLDPELQAMNFCNTVKSLNMPIILAVDLEYVTGADGQEDWVKLSLNDRQRNVLLFLSAIAKAFPDGLPLIYCGKAFMDEILPGLDLSLWPLWVCDYNTNHALPTLPAFWKRWDLWQQNDHDQEPGIIGPDDLDAFNGNLDDLKGLLCTVTSNS